MAYKAIEHVPFDCIDDCEFYTDRGQTSFKKRYKTGTVEFIIGNPYIKICIDYERDEYEDLPKKIEMFDFSDTFEAFRKWAEINAQFDEKDK